MTKPRKPKQKLLTLIIQGHEISLHAGKRYVACRQFITTDKEEQDAGQNKPAFLVRICEPPMMRERWRIKGLTYTQANDLLNEFNNDPRGSWHGREWK